MRTAQAVPWPPPWLVGQESDPFARTAEAKDASVASDMVDAADAIQSKRWGPGLTDDTPGIVVPGPLPPVWDYAWRREKEAWPLAWQDRWGRVANELAEAGAVWPADERRATDLVRAERTTHDAPPDLIAEPSPFAAPARQDPLWDMTVTTGYSPRR